MMGSTGSTRRKPAKAAAPASWLTLNEALAVWDISRQTFYRLHRAGLLPAGRKFGSHWRFTREEVERAGSQPEIQRVPAARDGS